MASSPAQAPDTLALMLAQPLAVAGGCRCDLNKWDQKWDQVPRDRVPPATGWDLGPTTRRVVPVPVPPGPGHCGVAAHHTPRVVNAPTLGGIVRATVGATTHPGAPARPRAAYRCEGGRVCLGSARTGNLGASSSLWEASAAGVEPQAPAACRAWRRGAGAPAGDPAWWRSAWTTADLSWQVLGQECLGPARAASSGGLRSGWRPASFFSTRRRTDECPSPHRTVAHRRPWWRCWRYPQRRRTSSRSKTPRQDAEKAGRFWRFDGFTSHHIEAVSPRMDADRAAPRR